MRTCFAIMPFGDGFEDIDRIIGDAASECKLDYVRGDRRQQPGSVVAQIVHDIRNAAVVVADISHANPNVFYELGIAHQLLGPERVVIITQPLDKPPYDVHEFRQLIYHHNEAGREKLRKELPLCLLAAIETRSEREVWNVIRGRLSRTRLLVRDLKRLITSSDGRLDGVVIRMVAGLGSLAISDHEPIDPAESVEYKENLLAERDLVREALLRGATMKCVLNPPRRLTKGMLPERLRVRYERLIGLLEGRSDITDDAEAYQNDLAAMQRCEFALTSVPMSNQIIIGEMVAYEGMKRGGTRGFEMTHCETEQRCLKELIEQFDRLFEESRGEMHRAGPPDGTIVRQLREFYQEASRPTTAP